MPGSLAKRAAACLDELGAISDEPPHLTRTFLSPALDRAKLLVADWMHEAGLHVFEDAAGNLIGRLENGADTTVACGSHIDTVRNAGKYDGAMGVVVGVLALAEIAAQRRRLPYNLEVVAFSDEEGVRFQTTYLGSRHYIGKLGRTELAAKDADGISVRDAIASHKPRFPAPPPHGRLIGYVEAHIEQGPVLEDAGLALGVVTGIAGQTRARITLTGKAGHAGTTPMTMRRDALAGAAECISLIEKSAQKARGLVATVGDLRIPSAASNVIPGTVEFTIDIRDAKNAVRQAFCKSLFAEIEKRMKKRNLATRIEIPLTAPSVPCSPKLTKALSTLITKKQGACPAITSGAGHDAVAISESTDVAMVFVRCRGGLSHHPAEFAKPKDIGLATEIMIELLSNFPTP